MNIYRYHQSIPINERTESVKRTDCQSTRGLHQLSSELFQPISRFIRDPNQSHTRNNRGNISHTRASGVCKSAYASMTGVSVPFEWLDISPRVSIWKLNMQKIWWIWQRIKYTTLFTFSLKPVSHCMTFADYFNSGILWKFTINLFINYLL